MEELYRKYRPQIFEEMVGNETAIKALRKEYENGSHVFLMTGSAGTGKCVDGNTIVAMNNGLYRISELVSDAKDGFNDYKQKLCSAESNGFLTSHFYKEKVNRTHRITLSNGIDIEGTPAHPLLIINSKTGKTEWKPMSEIVEGDTIISRTGTNVYGNDTVHNYTFIPKKNDTHNKIRDYCIPLNFDIGRLLGYLVANAIWDNNFKFTTGNEKIADDFINIIKTYFDVDVYRFVDKKCPRKVPYYTISKSVSMAILSMYDTKNMKWEIARYKHVPDVVLHGNKELQRGFLIGMIECDASYDGFNIELSTASYQMKQEMMSMFNNMGLLAWTGKKYLKSYDWTYYRIHTDYLSICNLYGDYKSLKYDFTKTVRVNPNKRTWTLPECVFNDYKKWREAHITKSGYIKGTNIRNKPVRFNKTNNITERIVNELVRAYMNYDNQLAYYAYAFSLYGWKYYQVKSNEIIDKETYVYDLTVPETHCFIANGIVSHNTTLARIMAKEVGATELSTYEINSADNRGIDTAREIIEQMNYFPADGKASVWIIDECFEANTLVDTEQGKRRISDIEVGDKVYTSNGLSIVDKVWKNKVPLNRLCKITLNTGIHIFATVDHLFYTTDGWCYAKDLVKGANLYERKQKSISKDMPTVWEGIYREIREGEILLKGDCPKGLEENCQIARARVESVEIYKHGSHEEPDWSFITDTDRNRGFVYFYDLDVRTYHNYFVEDILVHNCQQTSKDFQNALLKALEDTPDHVYFFLCTTDPQKILPAIKTRCSIVNLQPLNRDEMMFLLKRTIRAEKRKLDEDTIESVIDIAEGSSRKALKTLSKILYLDSKEEQEEALKNETVNETECIKLCRALMTPNVSWGTLSAILKDMNITEPERVRMAVMGYMNSVLLKGNRKKEAVSAIQAFSQADTFRNSKFAITVACLDYLELLGK